MAINLKDPYERILEHKRRILWTAGEVAAYEWTSTGVIERCWKNNADHPLEPITVEDLKKLNTFILVSLGFQQDERSFVWLMPIWLYGLMKPGEQLISFTGKVGIVGKTNPPNEDGINLDNRGGLLAYGFMRGIS